jgi:hypothetical protein
MQTPNGADVFVVEEAWASGSPFGMWRSPASTRSCHLCEPVVGAMRTRCQGRHGVAHPLHKKPAQRADKPGARNLRRPLHRSEALRPRVGTHFGLQKKPLVAHRRRLQPRFRCLPASIDAWCLETHLHLSRGRCVDFQAKRASMRTPDAVRGAGPWICRNAYVAPPGGVSRHCFFRNFTMPTEPETTVVHRKGFEPTAALGGSVLTRDGIHFHPWRIRRGITPMSGRPC